MLRAQEKGIGEVAGRWSEEGREVLGLSAPKGIVPGEDPETCYNGRKHLETPMRPTHFFGATGHRCGHSDVSKHSKS